MFYVFNPNMPYNWNEIGATAGDWIHSQAYDDHPGGPQQSRPSISSQIISTSYLPVFLPYLPTSHDEDFKGVCPDAIPWRRAGLKVRGFIDVGNMVNEDSEADQLLECFKQLWRLSIDDSTYQDIPWRFYYHPIREQFGLYSLLPIDHLSATEHELRIERYKALPDTTYWARNSRIYFWKE